MSNTYTDNTDTRVIRRGLVMILAVIVQAGGLLAANGAVMIVAGLVAVTAGMTALYAARGWSLK